ncbi:MAG: hypothetical protein J0I06_05225 [Planctomycetes bacterium]|nr:hypothetical protein [Planctomycetota bacterium]
MFGSSDVEPSPAALAAHLNALGLSVEPHFRGDDLGWTGGELRLPAGSPVLLSRYLTKEDDLRDDLNAHAAELETMDYSPNSGPLMQRVIQTRQLVTLRKPVDVADEVLLDKVLDAAVQFLAAATEGVYQIDGRGWFAASGELLVQEY